MMPLWINRMTCGRSLGLALLTLAALSVLGAIAQTTPLERIPPNDIARDFTLPDNTGKLHRLSDYRGKHVLTTFWTVDCHYCKEEMTSLELVYGKLKPLGLEIIAIHAGDKTEAINEMLKLSPLSYPILIDLDLSMRDWGIPAIPTTYLIGPDGQRLYRAVGAQQWQSDELTGFLENLISKGEGL